MLVADIAGEDRDRDADDMRDGLGVPGKADGRKDEAREADADDPDLRDRREIDQRETRVFRTRRRGRTTANTKRLLSR